MGGSSMGVHLWAAVCLLLLRFLAVSASAASSCSAGCKGGAAVYSPGHTYIYNVDGTTDTSVLGTKDEPVTMHFHATAEVAGLQDCKAVLRVKDVRVTGPGGKKYESLRELEKNAVIFTIADGRVDSQLCATEDEKAEALNIKRAIISQLQLPSKHSGKVSVWDVFGKCPSSVVVDGGKKDFTVSQTRNLNECYQRESINHRFNSNPYYVNSGIQSAPLLTATQTINQKVVNGYVQTAHSTEEYFFPPTSSKGTGVKTVVKTELTLKSQSQRRSASAGGATVSRSILFESPRDGSIGGSSAEVVVTALKRAANSMPVTVGENSAKEFRSLVKVMRKSSRDDLLTVYSQVKSGAGFSHSPMKLYQDALLQTRTGESVEVAVELLKSNEIKGDLAKLWYMSLPFVRNPTIASLAAVSTLLDEADLDYHTYFGIGSLAGRFCDSQVCEDNAVFAGLLNKLARSLAGGCKVTSRDQEDKLIVSLKALGNVHHLTESVSTIVQRCYSDSSAPTRVRVAALETAHTDACKHKKDAIAVLENKQEDSELRIKAFLVLMQCPTAKSANSLKEFLDNEKINQVGSFIVSYLRNLRATTNPERRAAKEFLQEVRTTRRFPLDFRKFSRNVELSYMAEGLNIGASGEGNLIHSQKSNLQRSVSFSLTPHIFGHSFNLFELGLRQENLERLLERYFGPKGFYTVTEPEEVIETNRGRFMSIIDVFKQRFQQTTRAKRSTNKQLSSTLKRATKSLGPDYDDNRIDLDISAKIFGSEVIWKNLGDSLENFSPEQAINQLFNNVDEGISEGKNIDVDMRQHFFMDEELTYPTGLGLSLNLELSGSSSVHLQVNSNLNLPALIKDPANANFHIKVMPSASVEFTAGMQVDAYSVVSGVEIQGQLHTATGSDVKVKSSAGRNIDVQVGLPLKKQELINLKSTVVSVVRESDGAEHSKALNFKTELKEYKGCFDQLANAVGLTFCSSLSLPWPEAKDTNSFGPLNGPSSLLIQMEAKDVPYYHLVIKKTLDDQSGGSIELSFDTPGSQTQRKIGLVLTRILEPEYKLAASFVHPRKTISGSLYEVDTAEEYSWNAKFVHDLQEYFARVGAKKSGSESHQVYTPILEYRTPSQTHQLSGGSTDGGFGCKGTITVDRTDTSRKYTLDGVTIQTPQGSLRADGTLFRQKNLFESDLRFTRGDDVIKYKAKVSTPAPARFNIEMQGQSSKYPDWGADVKWNYHREKNSLDNSLVVTHGRDLTSDKSRFTLKQTAKYKFENYHNFELEGKNTVEYPVVGLSLKLDTAATPKTLNYDFEFEFDTYKFGSELDVKRDTKQPGDGELKFGVEVGTRSLDFDFKREVTSKDKSKVTALLELKPGSRYELSSDLVHAIKQNDINLQHTSVLKTSGRSDYVKLISGFVMNQNEQEFKTELYSGREQHLNIKWKFNKAAENPSGNIKVFVNKILDADAQYKYMPGGKFDATMNINLLKLGREIRGTADHSITGTNHVASLDLFWDMGHDPSRKLHITSESDWKDNSIDSKNTLVINQEKVTANFMYSLVGELLNGHLIGEVELTLPKSEQLVFKLDREMKSTEDRSELEGKAEVVVRDSQGGTNSLSVDGKLVAVRKTMMLDSNVNAVLKTNTGKELSIFLKLRDVPAREKRQLEAQLDINSSQFKPFKLGASADVTQKEVVYKGHCSYGSEVTASTSGTLGLGKDGKVVEYDDNGIKSVEFTLKNILDLKLPSDKLRSSTSVTNMDIAVDKDVAKVDSQITVTTNGDAIHKLIIHLDAQPTSGYSLIEITLPADKPRSFAATWSTSKENDGTKEAIATTIKWGDKQEVTATVDIVSPDDDSGAAIRASAAAKTSKLGTADGTLEIKLSRGSPWTMEAGIKANVNGNKLDSDLKVYEGSFKYFPNIYMKSESQYGTYKFYVSLKQKSETEAEGDLELQWTRDKDWHLTLNGKAKYDSIDNFHVEVNADSEALQLNKWIITAQSKRAKGRNIMLISATSAGKNVLDGRLNYNYVEKENRRQFIAGGNIKYYDRQAQAHFEATLSRLTKETNQEEGSEVTVEFNLGERTYKSIHKLTNRELHVYHELCKRKGQCALTKLNSKVQINAEKNELNHNWILIVDLKSAGVPDSVEITATTATTQSVPLDHKLTIKLIGKTRETVNELDVYIHKEESGVVIKLPDPERVIAVIVQHHLKLDETTGSVDLSVVGNGWLDKTRQPEDKTCVTIKYRFDAAGKENKMTSEARFSNPALSKDLYITGNAVGSATNLNAEYIVSVFQKPNQDIRIIAQSSRSSTNDGGRISNSVKITSQGLNLDISYASHGEITSNGIDAEHSLSYNDVNHATKQLMVKLFVNKNGLTYKVKGPHSDLVNINIEVQRPDENTVKVPTLVVVDGIPAVIVDITLKTASPTLSVEIYKKSQPNAKIVAELIADIFKELGVRVHTINGRSEKKDLVNIQIFLTEDKFLKTEVDWSTENFIKFVDVCTSELDVWKHLKDTAVALEKEARTEFGDLLSVLRQGRPDIKPLLQSYQKQLAQIRDEIANEEGIRELSQYLSKSVARLRQAIAEILETLTDFFQAVVKRLEKIQDSITDAWEKLTPEFEKAYVKVIEVLTGVFNDVEAIILAYIRTIGKIIQSNEEDLKKLASVFAGFLEEIGKVIGKTIAQLRNDVKEFVNVLTEQIQSLPKFSTIAETLKMIQEELAALTSQLPEQVWIVLEEFMTAAKDVAPTTEAKDFIESFVEYIRRHLRQETMDETKELQALAAKASAAVSSLIQYGRTYLVGERTETPTLLGFQLPTSLTDLLKIPSLLSVQFSPLKYLASEDLPSWEEILITYRPRLNPLDWFPPYKAVGVVVDGQHFFTFDKRHFTFKGSCPYILVTDVVDSNFSIVLSAENGKFKSLLLTDGKNSIEVQQDRRLLVNGQASEYPAQAGGLSAWRRYHWLSIRSDSGVLINQDFDSGVISIQISGFYFGRTRGLLGTLSYEQADDFLQSNGELTENVNDFANSWKVGQCQDVPGAAHTASAKAQQCTNLFTSGSILGLAFPFIHPVMYREACDLAVEGASSEDAKNKAACQIARAYAATAYGEGIPVHLPNKCGHCDVAGQSPVEAGTDFSVRTAHAPHKAADIVIVLEQSQAAEEMYKELVIPLAKLLHSDLKSRGITDVVVHLMGWSDKQKWPQHYTTSGKLVFEGSAKNIHFYKAREPLPRETREQKIRWFIHELELELGVTELSKASWEVLQYPYRAGSSKALIYILGQPAEVGQFTGGLVQTIGAAVMQRWLNTQGIFPFVITPVEGLKLNVKDTKALKNIVGFDAERVYSLTDGKKKHGNTELRKTLEYKPNPGAWLPQPAEGITFVAQNFVDNKPQRQLYVQTVSHRISEALATEFYEDCVCYLKDGLYAESLCRVTGKKEREIKSKPRTKG